MHSAHFTLSSFYEPSILVNHYIPEVEYLVKAVTEASVHSQLRSTQKRRSTSTKNRLSTSSREGGRRPKLKARE
jgi:hypothetical protein